MAYSADSFTALEIPTLAKMNKLWANDASFNDGTGIGTNAITSAKIAAAAVGSSKLDYTTVTTIQQIAQLASDVSISAPSDTAIPGLGTVSVTADGKRRIKITFKSMELWRNGGGLIALKIWENGVGGTMRAMYQSNAIPGVVTTPPNFFYLSATPPAAGTYTFTVSIQAPAGQNANVSGALSPMQLIAELV